MKIQKRFLALLLAVFFGMSGCGVQEQHEIEQNASESVPAEVASVSDITEAKETVESALEDSAPKTDETASDIAEEQEVKKVRMPLPTTRLTLKR